MLPSEFWKTAAEQEDDWSNSPLSWYTLPFDAIEQLCTRLRTLPTSCKANRDRYASGFWYTVIEVVFEDGMLISERTTIPIPTVYSWSDSASNKLGFPYIICSAILGMTAQQFGQEEPFERYCQSLAKIHLDLTSIVFDQLGSIYFDPHDSAQYIIGPLASSGQGPYDSSATSQFSSTASRCGIHIVAHEQLLVTAAQADEESSAFMFSHGDLHYGNIMVNETGEIIGILDWDASGTMPLHSVAAQAREHFQHVFTWNTRFVRTTLSIIMPSLRSSRNSKQTSLRLQTRAAAITETVSLSERYASPTTQMLAFATRFLMFGSTTDVAWAKAFCRVLWDHTDWQLVRDGEEFTSWYEAIRRT
ncbi:hypothetical protein BKA62DRAFT_776824 [Auriculariales sp. MPI-PUGE-AT-0066]|nr:hypothetical protein BKA62DRAFT_776824 [Auriculariales sp. MPI-PUGE-AT-0066]